MNREHELKPCPFCGSANLKSGGDDKHVGYWCSECGSAGPNHYDSRYDWNRRAALEPAPKAQPLDLSNLLRHAFSCGYNSAAGEGGWEDYDPTACQAYHRIRAALSAPKAEAVTVKPLVWVDGKFSDKHPRETADSILGTYEVLQWAQGDFGGSVPAEDRGSSNREFCGAKTMEQAKAAAQADYEARILSAIDTSPVPAITDEAVERALVEWSKPNDKREPFEIMRAALLAAFPSKGGE